MGYNSFYDQLAPYYHLIYPDWDASMSRQATNLQCIIDEFVPGSSTILDAACGIGTQAIGLAKLGYTVTASDISETSVARAKTEASTHACDITFHVADLRSAFHMHARQFDVVLACDNAIPHLLSDADILTAFQQLYACTKPGGGCILSVRDYEAEDKYGTHVKQIGVRLDADARYFLWQVWEFDPVSPTYTLDLYIVEDNRQGKCVTHTMQSRYYAVGTTTLIELMELAGFTDVRRLDGRFFQPLLVGKRQ